MKKDKRCDEEKIDKKIDTCGERKQDNCQNMYIPMTDQDIKKLAEDMYKELIFTDRHIENKEEIPMVFMPLALVGREILGELADHPPGMIYEYMSKAGPMSINGMPIFASFRVVSIEDTKKVFAHYNKIRDAVASA